MKPHLSYHEELKEIIIQLPTKLKNISKKHINLKQMKKDLYDFYMNPSLYKLNLKEFYNKWLEDGLLTDYTEIIDIQRNFRENKTGFDYNVLNGLILYLYYDILNCILYKTRFSLDLNDYSNLIYTQCMTRILIDHLREYLDGMTILNQYRRPNEKIHKY